MPTDEVPVPYTAWCQGDFVKLDVAQVRMIYGGAKDGFTTLQPKRLDAPEYRGYVVISQTCDINRDIKRVPVVLVVPLVETQAYAEALRGRSPRFSCVDEAGEGLAADLATVMSVDKNYLVNWKREVGFTTDDGRKRFARDIERAFGRFAFPDEFNEIMEPFVRKIKEQVNKPKKDFGKKLLAVDDIRVSTTALSWDEKKVPLSFMIIWSDDVDDEQANTVQEAFSSEIKALAWNEKFSLLDPSVPARFGSYDDFSVRDYLSSTAIDVMNLSFSAHYQAMIQKAQG